MAKPSEKSPAINDLLSKLTLGGRVESIESDTCATCGEPATEFKDALSKKEFTISGMCQACQDFTFDGPPEENYEQ